MKIIQLFCILTGLVFCAACSIFPDPEQTETSYYDLDIPARIVMEKPVEVVPFSTITGERFRMAYREEGNIVRGNEFHKWVQTPGAMVTKYLRLTFRDDPNEKSRNAQYTLDISGSVLLFEVLDDYAELGVRYKIQYGSREKIFKTILIREKLTEKTPRHFAAAMSKAANQFALLLAKECKTLIDQEAAEKK